MTPELAHPFPQPFGHQGGCRNCWVRADTLNLAVPGRGHILMPCPLPSGNQATESLLARARCYGFLGQKKTAMFDFTSVLRTEPGNAQALCGRALLHLALDKQKVPAPRPPLGTGQVVVLRRGTALLLSPPGERTQSQASSVTHASNPARSGAPGASPSHPWFQVACRSHLKSPCAPSIHQCG